MTLVSSKMEEVEAAAKTVLEAAVWLDSWLAAAWSVVTANTPDMAKYHCLSVTHAKTVMVFSKTASVLSSGMKEYGTF